MSENKNCNCENSFFIHFLYASFCVVVVNSRDRTMTNEMDTCVVDVDRATLIEQNKALQQKIDALEEVTSTERHDLCLVVFLVAQFHF